MAWLTPGGASATVVGGAASCVSVFEVFRNAAHTAVQPSCSCTVNFEGMRLSDFDVAEKSGPLSSCLKLSPATNAHKLQISCCPSF